VYPLPPSAPLTSATGSSSSPVSGDRNLWPTPTAMDSEGSRNLTSGRQPGSRHHSGTTLTDAVVLWPTPKATDGERGGRGDLSMMLRQGKVSHRRDWPTPTAADAQHGPSLGRATGPNLAGAIRETWPTPTARDHKGPGYSGQLPTEMSGQPSPEFVEWLMGFPTRWTDSDHWATPLFPRSPSTSDDS
jgi:hypothetical protein